MLREPAADVKQQKLTIMSIITMNMEKSVDVAMTTTTMIMTTRDTSIIITIMSMEKSADVAMTTTTVSIITIMSMEKSADADMSTTTMSIIITMITEMSVDADMTTIMNQQNHRQLVHTPILR